MNYKLTITQKHGFLHAIVTGQNTKETVARFLQEVLRECIARDCLRVLIEERLEGPRLGAFDVFDIASAASERATGKLKAIAYVDVNAGSDLMQLAEDVAVNRGLRMAVFPTVAAAEAWMVQSNPGGTEPGAAPNGGPPPPLGNSRVTEGPPSVS
jgi:hypothetical protein